MDLLDLLCGQTKSLLVFTIIVLLVWFLNSKLNYWAQQGVPNIHPLKCFFLNIQLTLRRKPFAEVYAQYYKDLEGHTYGGAYQLSQPSIILRDPTIIKAWLIKEFSSFHDRSPKPDEAYDPLSRNLFELTGEKWRQVRQKVAPAFSSAKLKVMYQTLEECVAELSVFLAGSDEEIEVTELFLNFTLNVIGACAMGIKCNALQDPTCEFKRIVSLMLKVDWTRSMYDFLEAVHPSVPKFFGLRRNHREVLDFFEAVCRDAVEMKKRDVHSNRKDFLQILMNVSSSEVEKPDAESGVDSEGPIFTESLMMGVISAFISAGFEPIASTLDFCLYELAFHSGIQDRIYREIQTVKNTGGNATCYEDLKKYQYTEQVIQETLRKYPVGCVIARVCTEPFKIPDSSVVVERNTKIFIPMCGIQRDPKYFPEPEEFDPNRFSEENINNIVPGTYLPFGDGPRSCIAYRLAFMEIKTVILTIVSNYTVHTCAKTTKNMKFDPNRFLLSPKGKLWLRFQKRK